MYYKGRLSLYEGQYVIAEKSLEYAYRHMRTAEHFRNKRLALLYLIPAQLFLGKLPKQRLLESFHLVELADVVRAMRSGNLFQFDRTLEDHQAFFMKMGLYLLLQDKLHSIIYRNLIKRVYHVCDGSQTHRLSFEMILTAMRLVGTQMDSDEIECILANLIYQGFIKGYLSHSKHVMVLRKQQPFPAPHSFL
jgi:nuclear mRNA export protein PCID2/THP1